MYNTQQSKIDGRLALVGSMVLVGCIALSFRDYLQPSTLQLNAVSSTTTASATRVHPFAPHQRYPTMMAAAPQHADQFNAEVEEVPEAYYTTVETPAAPRTPAWVPMGILSAMFAALAAVFRPKQDETEMLQSQDLLQGPQGSRRDVLAGTAATAAALTTMPQPAMAGFFGGEKLPDWDQVEIPGISGEDFTFYDIEFLDDNKHGFLIGGRQTLLETTDAGKNWSPRYLNTGDDLPYRYTSISFSGEEGWLVGKPPILMHTTNGGKDWERIGLSAQLPGIPILVKALDNQGGAEMCTDQGGLYTTNTAAQTWKAAVEETVDATLNRTVSSGISGASYYTGSFGTISRSDDGSYIGVSSRGNFFMTWEPGQTYWFPHNRSGARRIQSMGWRKDGGLFEIGRGGQLSFGAGEGIQEEFETLKINTRGYGLLDLGWRTDNEVWAVGGSGTLVKSVDGGKKWIRQRDGDGIAANLYEVKFFDNGKIGFVLGNGGVLLRYTGGSA